MRIHEWMAKRCIPPILTVEQCCTWRTISYCHPLKHGYRQMLSHNCIEWMSEKAPTTKTDYETICFEAKCALHRMSIGDKSNIIDEAETFLFTIWLEELRGIYWEEHWAYNHELLYCKLWDACLDDWIVSKKTDDNIYLKSTVSIGGKSMTDWQSKMRLNTRKPLDGRW